MTAACACSWLLAISSAAGVVIMGLTCLTLIGAIAIALRVDGGER
jgi:hypothetical protein